MITVRVYQGEDPEILLLTADGRTSYPIRAEAFWREPSDWCKRCASGRIYGVRRDPSDASLQGDDWIAKFTLVHDEVEAELTFI